MEAYTMKEYIRPSTRIRFQNKEEYHVFLSFRGKDVRNTLVHCLYEALTAAGLYVFLDAHKLKKGEIIGLNLISAVESSAIRIPIFSRGYAASAWCLKEAAAMLKTPGLIIPLFYDMDPTNVRYPLKDSSPYKQAFVKHYGHSDRYPREEIEGWEDALIQICSRSGWSMDMTGGSEAQLVKKVVNDVISTFDRVPFFVANHPVGLESVIGNLIHKFKLNSKGGVVKAGIWGMGGIGKTALAKALYNQVSANFDAASFVFGVRTAAAEDIGLIKVQKQILRDLSSYGGEVNSVEEGIFLFRYHFSQKCVLLILDDVDRMKELNALVEDSLAPGSRVIITTRNRHILKVAGISSECIHEMSGLEINESLHLFSWHAFLRTSPSPTHQGLSERIVCACKGHPLSLEVIGSFLYDRRNDPDCWIEVLDNITRHQEIHRTLYISYKALSEEEKEIFLDIACFFIGEHKRYPIVFWNSMYRMVHTAIHNLSQKLLIKIDDEGVFHMHDHLRDMGQCIAEEERQGYRLWNAFHLSRRVSNNNNFSRLRLSGRNSQRLETLCGPGLRFLHLENLPIDSITGIMLPPGLIWLRLQNCEKPSNFSLRRNIWRFAIRWPFNFRLVDNISDLRILQIDGDISNFQYLLYNILGNLSHLEHLELRNLKKLNNFPRTIGNLSELKCLDLEGCEKLNELPNTIGHLSQLQILSLRGCTKLSKLPDTMGNLSQLQTLSLRGCTKLSKLPDTIGNLCQLQHLDLWFCTELNCLTDNINTLSQLEYLNLSNCKKLNNLSHTIGYLSHLQYLNLSGSSNLNNLPHNIGNLSQLQHLDLTGCTNLNNLPDSIGYLSQLQHLNLSGCMKLNNLPYTIGNLSQLQHLDLSKCEYLNNPPDTICNLSQLQHLDLSWCKHLYYLPDTIDNLSELQYLDLRGCEYLSNLPDTIGNLSQLQHLDLSMCTKLDKLPCTISNLHSCSYSFEGLQN